MNNRYSLLLGLPFFILTIFIVLNVDLEHEAQSDTTHINAVLGDESYIHQFGEAPGPNVPDDIRIRVHLEYVEGLLRNRPVDHLTDQQAENRFRYLDMLKNYYSTGEFPYNDGHPDSRRPAFISEDGNICAVGYLVERSLGRDIAEAINQEFKYSYIGEIDDPTFLNWADESGFTLKELAMIQPAYRTVTVEEKVNHNYVEPVFGAGSALLAGLNTIYLANNNYHWFGLAAGTGSIILGSLNIDNSYSYIDRSEIIGVCTNCQIVDTTVTNHARSGVAAINLGLGLATVAVSGYNLLRKSRSTTTQNTGLDVTTIQMHHTDPVPALRYSFNF